MQESFDRLSSVLEAALEPAEKVVALLRLDLDDQLRFGAGLLALTGQRLLAVSGRLDGPALRDWSLLAVSRLVQTDRGGLGTLEAHGDAGLLARWSYTLGRSREAGAFAEALVDLKAGRLDASGGLRPDDVEIPEGVGVEVTPRVGTLWRLSRFVRPQVGWLALGVALAFASTVAGLIPPLLTWPLVDDVLSPYQNQVKDAREAPGQDDAAKEQRLTALRETGLAPFKMVPWYLLGMLAAAVAAWGLSWCQGWVLAHMSERIAANLRNTTYAHVQSLSLDYFSANRTGDLVARISSDTERICNFLSDTLADFVTDGLMIVGTTIMLFYMDPVLALATLCTFPLVAWLTVFVRTRLADGFLQSRRAWGEMTSVLADTIPGVRVVKAFAQEDREVVRFGAANARIVAANDRVNRLWTFFWPMVALLNQFGLLVAWAFGAWAVYDQRVTVGVLTAFLAYITRFYGRMESMSRMTNRAQQAAASAKRVFEILDRAPSVPEPAHPVSPGRVRGKVDIRGVSFRFGNRRVIDDVSLAIEPGEMVGVVGTTGAGKSTLLNLVCRFYDVSDGAICVDGVDIRSFPIHEFRRNIGIVLQDPFLFYGTIAENIAYGRPDATRAEIVAATRAARAHEFVLQLPDGYDSIVGERGQTLSGGERQRISIARALLIDPRILILDEATSSVDTQTEMQIQEALDNLVRGRTTIAIAHRLSTLRNADRIVVLDQGRIVEMGTHDALLALGNVYHGLFEAQLKSSHHEPEREPIPLPEPLLREPDDAIAL